MSSLMTVLTALEARGFENLKPISGGNVATSLYRGCAADTGELVVIKIGLTETDGREVAANMEGYKRIQTMGGGSLLPDRLEFLELDDVPLIVMSDCGQDFRQAVGLLPAPREAYVSLVTSMEDVYRRTAVSSSARSSLERMRSGIGLVLAGEVFAGLIESRDIEALQAYDLGRVTPHRSCFADFNFTPENVFLAGGRVRYIDPTADVVGIPIIDLACFSGVATAYGLAGHAEGAKTLEWAATQGMLPDLLGLTGDQARRLFVFGRVLQTAYSAHYRLKPYPEQGRQLVEQCVSFLRRFVSEESCEEGS